MEKGSKRSRKPLKHLPKTYDNRMSLPSGNSPLYHPTLPINSNTMDSNAPPSSVAASANADNSTPPPVESSSSTATGSPPIGNVEPGAGGAGYTPQPQMQTYQHVGDKRIKIDHHDGYSVSPSVDATPTNRQVTTALPYADAHPATMYDGTTASGEETFDGATTKAVNPECLALPEDKKHLTELHCFVRKHNVYLFCADASEVGGKSECSHSSMVCFVAVIS